jgi:HK97 gp10 family phage protein
MPEVTFTRFVANPAIADEVGEEICRPLVTELAEAAGEHADRNVPVLTGGLRRSKRIVVIGTGRGVRAELRYEADHAWFVEAGTEDTPPQPYLRPALIAIQSRTGVS